MLTQKEFDISENKPLSQKIAEAESMIREYYLNDERRRT